MRNTEQELALKPWLYRIAHNAALNILRAAKGEGEALDEDRPGATQTADVVELRERLRETLASIQALPAAQRDALLLRAVEGRSHEEIAVALGVTAGGARQHLHRARVTLRAAASAITPYPLLTRVLSAAASEGGRGADIVSGAGLGAGAGAMKAAAGVLAAGAIAGGAVTAQHHHSVKPSRATAAEAAGDRSTPTSSAANGPSVAALVGADKEHAGATPHRDSGHGRQGARRPGRGHRDGGSGSRLSAAGDSGEHSGSGEHHGSSGGSGSSGGDQISHSGSGGHGSDDTTVQTTTEISGSDGHSGSDDATSSGSSGPGGGETTTTTPTTTTDDSLDSSHSGKDGGSDDSSPTTTTSDG